MSMSRSEGGSSGIPSRITHPPALGPSAVYSFSAVFSGQVDRLFKRLGNVTPLPGEEFAAPWELIVRESG
jgi:hypothetical protein